MFRIVDSKSNHWFMHFKSRGSPEHSHDKLVRFEGFCELHWSRLSPIKTMVGLIARQHAITADSSRTPDDVICHQTTLSRLESMAWGGGGGGGGPFWMKIHLTPPPPPLNSCTHRMESP